MLQIKFRLGRGRQRSQFFKCFGFDTTDSGAIIQHELLAQCTLDQDSVLKSPPTRSNRQPKYALIIPARNAEASLALTLDSVQSQTYQNFEVILVDNASTDGTLKIAENFQKLFRKKGRLFQIVKCAQPGRGVARNSGAKLAHVNVEHLVFIDADVILDRQWLFHIDSYLNKLNVDAVASQIIPADSYSSTTDRFRRALAAWKTHNTFMSVMSRYGPAPLIATAACAVRRSSFFELNGFNTKMKRNEDVEFSLRLFKAGFLIGATTKAKSSDSFQAGRLSRITQPIAYLKRTFETRYHHVRPRLSEIMMGRYMIKAALSDSRRASLLPLSIMNQFLFNIGAFSNFLFNTQPLKLDFSLDDQQPLRSIQFKAPSRVCKLKSKIRLIIIDDHVFYFDSSQKRFFKTNPRSNVALKKAINGQALGKNEISALLKLRLFEAT